MSSKTLMDLAATLVELQSRKLRLQRIIAELEELQARDGSPRERRGRKYMGAEERAEVSRRMKTYWANRRKLNEKQQTA